MKIDEKIRQNRVKAGMTQEQLANKLGVSAQSVSKWENSVAMPDIMLLPNIAEVFGISIDELFDLTAEQKMNRIENRIDIDPGMSEELFNEYKCFLEEQMASKINHERAVSLLANLYHRRIELDSKMVSKYARESILINPAKKDCQWLLSKAEGHAVWDWNIANHSNAIEFYISVIENDKQTPKSALPYYFLIDNLLADNRSTEAADYLAEFSKLPSANPVMVDIYKAYVALSNHEVATADKIIEDCVNNHRDDNGYLFEAAQYYARKCDYDNAIKYYRLSWDNSPKPRYTDALQGIATIYKILGQKEKAKETYEQLLDCLVYEWGYTKDDAPYIETQQDMHNI